MLKCHYCEFSQMQRGEIHCPCDGCVMPKAEIERLNGLPKSTDDINRIKSEAIKDALNRAKKRIGDSHFQNYGLAMLEIMDVEKEMVGDGEDV